MTKHETGIQYAKVILLFAILIFAIWNFGPKAPPVYAQIQNTCTLISPTIGGLWGTQADCSPTQLGVNGLTLPANPANSALSTIIDTRGVKEATLEWSCTAAAMTMSLNVQTYAEDGTTTLALVTPVSALASGTTAITTIGSESNPATSSGTLATAPAGVVRFPQRALAFSFLDSGATTGTCSARLFLNY